MTLSSALAGGGIQAYVWIWTSPLLLTELQSGHVIDAPRYSEGQLIIIIALSWEHQIHRSHCHRLCILVAHRAYVLKQVLSTFHWKNSSKLIRQRCVHFHRYHQLSWIQDNVKMKSTNLFKIIYLLGGLFCGAWRRDGLVLLLMYLLGRTCRFKLKLSLTW